MIYLDHINDIVCIQWSMNLNLHIKWDACNFYNVLFFKSIITIFSFTDILSLVDIFSISNILWNVHNFLFSFWLTLGLTLEIFVKSNWSTPTVRSHFKQNFKNFRSNICSRQRNLGLWTQNRISSQKMLYTKTYSLQMCFFERSIFPD